MEELSQTELARVAAGFPRELGSRLSAWRVADMGRSLGGITIETVHVCDEEVRIPDRVYFGAPLLDDSREPLETAMIHCVYTRHHDGYVRESHVAEVLRSPAPWAVPYLVRLLGAPVAQITEQIESGITDTWANEFRVFAQNNDAFMRLTRARARSYWHFHRHRFRNVDEYPAIRVLNAIRLLDALKI